MKKKPLSMKKLYELANDYSRAKSQWIDRNKWEKRTKTANFAKLKKEIKIIVEFLDFIWKAR